MSGDQSDRYEIVPDVEGDPQMCDYCEEWVERREDLGGAWIEHRGRLVTLKVKHRWCWDGMAEAVELAHDAQGQDDWWATYGEGDSVSRQRQASALRRAS